jgi:hypothetical protein
MHVKQKSRCADVTTCLKRKLVDPGSDPHAYHHVQSHARPRGLCIVAAWLKRHERKRSGGLKEVEMSTDASGGVTSRRKEERTWKVLLLVLASNRQVRSQIEECFRPTSSDLAVCTML